MRDNELADCLRQLRQIPPGRSVMAKKSVTIDDTTILGVRFVRWGLGFFIFGLIFGFGLLGYYFHGTIESAMLKEGGAQWLNYPWTFGTYVLQVGGLGMVAIGAVYWLLPGDKLETESMDHTALWLCIAGLVATFLTSYVGYFVANAIWPSFFYESLTQGMNAWIMSQAVSVALYLFGVVLAFFSIRHVTNIRIPHG
jgi:hypothetical protein